MALYSLRLQQPNPASQHSNRKQQGMPQRIFPLIESANIFESPRSVRSAPRMSTGPGFPPHRTGGYTSKFTEDFSSGMATPTISSSAPTTAGSSESTSSPKILTPWTCPSCKQDNGGSTRHCKNCKHLDPRRKPAVGTLLSMCCQCRHLSKTFNAPCSKCVHQKTGCKACAPKRVGARVFNSEALKTVNKEKKKREDPKEKGKQE
ncbi:hypothetical protein FN846DRAFT_894539 [Sphaerosporella brunnea]|uniref:RanBP2-type domain-containing protein n=1 Tax=Sphaerosporella brunnea TaxID=1250544 RepID=A0A5J5EJ00_9PEZI|nr:hypothetical protein FN846DRAFT_894539 [Sphaerosporella brunnea]